MQDNRAFRLVITPDRKTISVHCNASSHDSEAITPTCAANQAYTVNAINAINTRRGSAHDREVQSIAAADAARDDHVAVQWELHNAMLGAKDQVIAQFGLDSNEAQAMKLKKKSEYKTPKRKPGDKSGGSKSSPPTS